VITLPHPLPDFNTIIAALESKGMFPLGPPRIDHITAALHATGLMAQINPDRVILVAGTNGKGSTSAMLDALLQSAGQKTGLYTSPHLIKTTERFRIAGIDISEALFCQLYHDLYDAIEDFKLSHFEALTLIAAKAFVDAQCDWMIFEVGLGGTWDATNAIPHHYGIITPLDFDHMALLGHTLTEIAGNKFGIVTHNSKIAYAPLPDEVIPLQQQVMQKTNSTWTPRHDFSFSVRNDKTAEPQFFITYNQQTAQLALPGQRGAENAALALTAFAMLGFDPLQHLSALQKVQWGGRMERLTPGNWPCPIYLSGDHNRQGIDSLLEVLTHYSWDHLHLLVGIGENKDIDSMLGSLSQLPRSSLYLTETTYRSQAITAYGSWLDKAAAAGKDFADILDYIEKQAKPGDLVLVTGSLYLVGSVRGYFAKI
jgi:dihydrofolate synthase/folylpolyglutamate synthase